MTGFDYSLLMAFSAVAGYLAMRPVALAIKNGAIRDYNQVADDYRRDLESLNAVPSPK